MYQPIQLRRLEGAKGLSALIAFVLVDDGGGGRKKKKETSFHSDNSELLTARVMMMTITSFSRSRWLTLGT